MCAGGWTCACCWAAAGSTTVSCTVTVTCLVPGRGRLPEGGTGEVDDRLVEGRECKLPMKMISPALAFYLVSVSA